MFGLREPALGEVGQLQVVEEDVEELLARQHEAEASSPSPSPASFGLPPPSPERGSDVALDEFLVARQHDVAAAALDRGGTRLVECRRAGC